MYSMTTHILGGLLHAATKSTTLGLRSAIIARTWSIKQPVGVSFLHHELLCGN
jgi:multisubunit Na+/H+ antiporter MnhG subunit